MPPICYLQVNYSSTTSTHYHYLVWTDWFSDDSDGSFGSEGERFGRVHWRSNKIASIIRFDKPDISSVSNKSSQIHDKGISAQQFCSVNMDSSTEKTIKEPACDTYCDEWSNCNIAIYYLKSRRPDLVHCHTSSRVTYFFMTPLD